MKMNVKITEEAFNKITLNLLILLLIIVIVGACHKEYPSKQETAQKKGNIDCSMNFTTATATTSSTASKTEGASTEITTKKINLSSKCKILPLQINKDTKCEISGSDKVDNLLDFYNKTPAGKTIFMAPTKSLFNAYDMSYKDMVKYHFLIKKVKTHIDSDLFASLKDFRYKGMSCSSKGLQFTSWISDENIIIIYDYKETKKVFKETKKVFKNTPAKKHKEK